MAANEPSLSRIVSRWVSETIIHNWTDFRLLIRNVFIVGVCTAILTLVWSIGWERSITWHIMYAIAAGVPGPPGPVFVAPLAFLIGLASIFILDDYKRLQGLLLVVPGLIIMVVIMLTDGRFSNPEVWRPITYGTFLLFGAFGMAYGGALESLRDRVIGSNGPSEMKRGFGRLITVVVLVSSLGIFEATIDYPSPVVWDPDPTVGTVIPIMIPESAFERILTETTLSAMPSPLPSGPVSGLIMMVGSFAVLAGLVYALRDLTEYERNKNALLVGPDRAGKTWLMSGAGYALRQQAQQDAEFQEPEYSQSMIDYVAAFADEDFNAQELEANDPGEFNFFSFKFDHGILPKRRVQFQSVDYAGEMIQNVNLSTPFTVFNDAWGDKEGINPDEIPNFDLLSRFDTSPQLNVPDPDSETIYPDDIAPLLSVMIDEYDSLGLIIPADELIADSNMDDDDLPDHIEMDDINALQQARATEAQRLTAGRNSYGYFELYREIIKQYGSKKDIFFIVTMSDMFLETYSNETTHQDPKGNPNWDRFRQHIYSKIESQRGDIDFMSQSLAENYKRYYPVYFEPRDPPGYRIGGTIRPYLDWDDEYYFLRGLSNVLKRIGR